MKKTIVGPDVGRGSKLFEGSQVHELIHSSGVIIEDTEKSHIYCSGVVALGYDEATGKSLDELVSGGMAEQTDQLFRNLSRVLARVDAHLNDVVRVRVYVVAPMSSRDFQTIHEVRARFFEREHYPASTLVVVAGLARAGALIEIDADAVIPRDGQMELVKSL